ncbi:MAG: hypothetical protein RDV41_10465 [Planctomycetota bacterium]|nr:hypothetical protein [Planctomycetota bacterium]
MSGLPKRLLADFRSARTWLRTVLHVRRFSKARQVMKTGLAESYIALGAQAETSGISTDLTAFGEVSTLRERLIVAQGDLEQKELAVKTALGTQTAEAGKHAGIVAALEAGHHSLHETMLAAEDEVDNLLHEADTSQKLIHRLQFEIDASAHGRPITIPMEVMKQKIAALEGTRARAESLLPDAKKKLADATAMADAKAAEVQQAKVTARTVALECEDSVVAAQVSRRLSRKAAEALKLALNGALEVFGRAVFEAAPCSAELAQGSATIRAYLDLIAKTDDDISFLRNQADRVRPAARRFALASIVALFAAAIVFALGFWLVRGCRDEAGNSSRAAATDGSPSAATGTTTPAVSTGPESGPATPPEAEGPTSGERKDLLAGLGHRMLTQMGGLLRGFRRG